MAQFVGRVIGTKMQKTAKVSVTRMFLNPIVLKVWCDKKCIIPIQSVFFFNYLLSLLKRKRRILPMTKTVIVVKEIWL